MKWAWISGSAGRAIVRTRETTFLVDVRRPGSAIEVDEHISHLFFDQCWDAKAISVDEDFPFERVRGLLKEAWRRDRALRLLLIGLDCAIPEPIRREALEAVNELLAMDGIEASVRNRLMSYPLPAEADCGLAVAAGRVGSMITEILGRQAAVRRLYSGWKTIEINEGILHGDGIRIRQRCVDLGGFTEFARAIAEKNPAIMRDWLETAREDETLGDEQARLLLASWHRTVLESLLPELPSVKEHVAEVQPRETRRAVTNFRSILEALGVDFLDVTKGASEVPELALAVEDFERALERGAEEFKARVESDHFYTTIVPYALGEGRGGFVKQHAKMEDFLNSLSIEVLGMGRMERAGKKSFETALEKAARSARIVLLTHFFLTMRRRKDWGVLPIADQMAIGFVFHRTNARLSRFLDSLLGSSYAPQSLVGAERGVPEKGTPDSEFGGVEGRDVPAALAQQFIVRMAQTVVSDRGSLYYLKGFAMEDIINDVLFACGETRALGELPLFTETIRESGGTNEASAPIFYRLDTEGEVDERSAPAPAVLERGVCAFDIAHLKEIRRKIGAAEGQYRIVCIRHGVGVPVGVGFSLPMLPYMFLRRPPNHAVSEIP